MQHAHPLRPTERLWRQDCVSGLWHTLAATISNLEVGREDLIYALVVTGLDATHEQTHGFRPHGVARLLNKGNPGSEEHGESWIIDAGDGDILRNT